MPRLFLFSLLQSKGCCFMGDLSLEDIIHWQVLQVPLVFQSNQPLRCKDLSADQSYTGLPKYALFKNKSWVYVCVMVCVCLYVRVNACLHLHIENSNSVGSANPNVTHAALAYRLDYTGYPQLSSSELTACRSHCGQKTQKSTRF